ncbi:DUF983 domain-containing protein [Taibaiella sp. KBW10]|uniref:DUF983 domain-containing protein n=1 Tax=Taibaiella sp. KBW10 TaxID=2153357 RepID=UPI000F5A4CAD|nr:DUF983 domain-containing protein [Taibaiella sp. KBW10]RQO30607.1 DUF983 domain-containing protein [Taibaiella sp. KBW10]
MEPSQNIAIPEHNSSFLSVLQCKCPHCGKGKMFTHTNPYNLKYTLDMPKYCNVCGVDFEPEPGFYFGTGYVSYGLSIALTFASIIVAFLFFGLSLKDNSLYYWIASNAALLILIQPVMMRLSRSIWLWFFKHKLMVPANKEPLA